MRFDFSFLRKHLFFFFCIFSLYWCIYMKCKNVFKKYLIFHLVPSGTGFIKWHDLHATDLPY